MTEQNGVREVAAGVEPLDQRRVSVVCRTIRVDLSLPAHLELVAVIPEIVDLVREHIRVLSGPSSGVDVDARMGGDDAGGTWQLSRLAGGPLPVSETLAQQRVHDGEILVLDHRPVPTPAPLFDDVVQGLTDPEVARSAAWGRRDTVRAAAVATAVVAVAAAAALARQWWTGGGAVVPLAALSLALVGLVAVVALRGTAAPVGCHAVAGASAVGFTILAAGTVGSAPVGADHLLGGFTTAGVLAAVLRVTVFRPLAPSGDADRAVDRTSYALASGYLALALALGVGALGAAGVALTGAPASAAGASAVLLGLLLLTAAPRLAVTAAGIPIPPVPTPGEDVAAGDVEQLDHDVLDRISADARERGPLPTPGVLRHRFLASRSWLTGLLGAGGAVCAVGSLVSLTGGADSARWATPMTLVLVIVLVLRGLGYVDRVHVTVLFTTALLLTAGVLVGASVTVPSPVGVVVPSAVAVAAAVCVAATVLPRVVLSPAALRAVGTVEAVLLCVVVPLAVGAMGVYALVRQR